jgi:hypothetical protein
MGDGRGRGRARDPPRARQGGGTPSSRSFGNGGAVSRPKRVLCGAGLVNLYEALCNRRLRGAALCRRRNSLRPSTGLISNVLGAFSIFAHSWGRWPTLLTFGATGGASSRRDTAAVQGSVGVVSVPRKIRTKGTFRQHAGQNSDLYRPRKSPALLGLAHLALAG